MDMHLGSGQDYEMELSSFHEKYISFSYQIPSNE